MSQAERQETLNDILSDFSDHQFGRQVAVIDRVIRDCRENSARFDSTEQFIAALGISIIGDLVDVIADGKEADSEPTQIALLPIKVAFNHYDKWGTLSILDLLCLMRDESVDQVQRVHKNHMKRLKEKLADPNSQGNVLNKTLDLLTKLRQEEK